MPWDLIGVILASIFFFTTVVLTIVVAVRFYKRKQPVWAYKTKKIIGLGSDAPEELQIFFASIHVNEVYRTKFIFFNRGNESIRCCEGRDNDVSTKVTVHFGQGLILREPIVVKASRPDIKFLAKKVVDGVNQSVELDFSFLGHDDGAVIEVLHTQNEPERCSGTIIDAKEIEKVKEFVPYRPLDLWGKLKKRETRPLLVVLIVYSAAIIWAAAVTNATIAGVWFGCIVSFSLLGLLSYYRRNKFPKWTKDIEL